MKKRGKIAQSNIIVTVILILVALAAVVFIGIFIRNQVKSGTSEDVNAVALTVALDIREASLNGNILTAKINRPAGKGNLSSLRFTLKNSSSSYTWTEDNPNLNELETKTYSLNLAGKINNPEIIYVTPVFGSKKGIEVNKKVTLLTQQPKCVIDADCDADSICSNGVCKSKYALTGCGVLDKSGKTYTLQNDVSTTGTCFTITADNVTLDLNGKNVTGDNSGQDYGIYANGRNNITIKNGRIDWFGKATNNGYGVYFTSVTNSTIINLTTSNNGYGISLWSSSNNNNFYNTTSTSNSNGGIYSSSSSYNNFYNTISTLNNYNGIFLVSSSSNNFYNTISSSNDWYGIILYSSSNNNNFYNTTFASNNRDGIYLYLSSNNNNFYTTSTSNNANGIHLESGSSNNFNNFESYSNTQQEIYSDDWGSSTGNILTYNNSFGEIMFRALSADVEGDLRFGDGYNIQIANNSAFLNSSSDISELNVSANVTLYNIGNRGFAIPRIMKDGAICSDCYNFTSLTASTVVFNVSSWSNYSIGDGLWKGIAGYWNFDSDSGNTIIDSKGMNSGTIIGGSLFETGKRGNAIRFNGSNYAVVPSSSSLNISRALTISAWIKPYSFTNAAGIIAKQFNGTSGASPFFVYGITLDWRNNLAIRYTTSNNTNYYNGDTFTRPNVLSLNTWTNIIATYNGSTRKVYVNSIPEANIYRGSSYTPPIVAGDLIAPLLTNNEPLFLGVDCLQGVCGSGARLNASLDEIGIWNRSLSQEEITALYNSYS